MSDIIHNLNQVTQNIKTVALECGRDPEEIKLVAVSKRFPVSAIETGLKAGHNLFGENYIQEAAEKYDQLTNSGETNARIHFIGHLQSNKTKTAAAISSMIETVDRLKLARVLNKHLVALNKNLDILIQVNIGKDHNKSGVFPEDAQDLLQAIKDEKLTNLSIRGLMTMPPITPDAEEARPFFRNLRQLSQDLAEKSLFTDNQKIELSMGMSSDYHVAIQEGATLVRVGTAIFGQRPVLEKA